MPKSVKLLIKNKRSITHPPKVPPRRLITWIAWCSDALKRSKASTFRNNSGAPNTFNLTKKTQERKINKISLKLNKEKIRRFGFISWDLK
jgi:hypothetical protein